MILAIRCLWPWALAISFKLAWFTGSRLLLCAYLRKNISQSSANKRKQLLKTGDIVGVTTTQAGIDIAHTGLCIKDERGVVHFMDASSSRRNMKVTLEPEIRRSLNWSSELTGVMFARPLEVGKV